MEPVIVDYSKEETEPSLGNYEEVLHINAARSMGIREYDRTYNVYDNNIGVEFYFKRYDER